MASTRIAMFGMIAMTVSSAAFGADSVLQQDSVGRMGVATMLEVMRITADGCSAVVPQLKVEFDTQLTSRTPRIRKIGDDLLLSEDFKDLRSAPVPVAMVDVMRKEFQLLERNSAIGLSPATCSAKLDEMRRLDDAVIGKSLSDSFAIMRTIMKNIGSQSAR